MPLRQTGVIRMSKWYDMSGKNDDVVVASRIRLARNFKDYVYSGMMEKEDSEKLIQSVTEAFQTDHRNEYNYCYTDRCGDIGKQSLKERLIINEYLGGRTDGAAIISEDESAAILLNAEDHVRIQVVRPGMNMAECFNKANEIDDYIDGHFDYAFDEKYGYKTTYPTNIGTGLRASYILFLPSLRDAKKLSKISTELGRFGMKFKSVFNEGNNHAGSFFRISSQRSIGLSEKEIIKDLDDMVIQLINQEREQRNAFYTADRTQMEDEVFKSYGVMKYARKLAFKDAMMLISELKQGINLGILNFKEGTECNIIRMIMDIMPSVICERAGEKLSADEIDIERATYLRNNIPDIV